MDTHREGIVIITLIVLFIVVILGLFGLRNSLNQAPALQVSLENITYTDRETIEVKGKTDKGSKLKINNKDVNVDKNGNFTVQEPLSPGENSLTVEATKGTKKTTSQKTIVRQEPGKSVAGSETSPPIVETTPTNQSESKVALNDAGPAEDFIGVLGLTAIFCSYVIYRKSIKAIVSAKHFT